MAQNKLSQILAAEKIAPSKLAKLAGVSAVTVTRALRRSRSPSPGTMRRLVEAINRLARSKRYRLADVFPVLAGVATAEFEEETYDLDYAEDADGPDGDPTTDY